MSYVKQTAVLTNASGDAGRSAISSLRPGGSLRIVGAVRNRFYEHILEQLWQEPDIVISSEAVMTVVVKKDAELDEASLMAFCRERG